MNLVTHRDRDQPMDYVAMDLTLSPLGCGSGSGSGLGLGGGRCTSPPASSAPQLVDNGAQCTARLATLCNSAKFSDVTLNVAGRKTFHAHKLLLANASDVFEQMLTSEHWQSAGEREFFLQEQDDCVVVFEDFLHYIYSGQVELCTDNVLGLLVLADKYNIGDLKQCCCSYMAEHLVAPPDVNKAIIWYQYAIACSSSQLQQACFSYILLNIDTVIQSPDWVYLDKENLIVLLQRSDLVVRSEYRLLQAVIRWLTEEHRSEEMKENLTRILPYIRFPMILPEHLSEFEESEFERENHALIAPYLLSAYRYHALSIKAQREPLTDVPKTQFMYRNYTDDNYSIHVDVVRKGYRSCPRVSSKLERPLSLPVSICNTAADKQCKMKVTFYPQGYYTTSLWNGQLNLAKSTELTKLIVAHRGGLELHEAEVSVVVYGQQGGLRYADRAISNSHIFETYGTYEVDNVVDLERLKEDGSPYVIDGALMLKVFVRPISFHRADSTLHPL